MTNLLIQVLNQIQAIKIPLKSASITRKQIKHIITIPKYIPFIINDTNVMTIITLNKIELFYFTILIQRPINTIHKQSINNTSVTTEKVYDTELLILKYGQNQIECLVLVLHN